MSDLTIPSFDPGSPLDLRRPLTVEQMIADCGDKIANDAQENPDKMVEIMLGTELMMEIGLRLIALEVDAGLLPLEKPPGDAPEGESQPV
jgi:hypothetical protein